jgi:hypothetical protein
MRGKPVSDTNVVEAVPVLLACLNSGGALVFHSWGYFAAWILAKLV